MFLLITLFFFTTSAWDCYDTWSRCTGWSSPATGTLWQSCEEHCQGCYNKAGGECIITGTTTCMGVKIEAYQCQCSRTSWTGENKPHCGI